MLDRLRVPLRHPVLGYCVAILGPTLVSWVDAYLERPEHIAPPSLVQLLLVMAVAFVYGSQAGLVASLAAFLSMDWFVARPESFLTVRDLSDWTTLAIFLAVAVVTSQFTALLRTREDQAQRYARQATALSEASWTIAAMTDRDRALQEVIRWLQEVVPVEGAAVLQLDDGPSAHIAATHGRVDPDRVVRLAEAVAREVEGAGDSTSGGISRLAADGTPAALGVHEFFIPLRADSHTDGILYVRELTGSPLTGDDWRIVQALAHHAEAVFIRERLIQTETLVRATQEAERLKAALLSMVSHDFRSPLGTIKAGVTSLLQAGEKWDPESLRELLLAIDQDTDRLNTLIEHVLFLSQLEAGQCRPLKEPTAVAEVVGAALDTFNREENARIQVEMEPGLGDAWIDPVQFVQILRNLVENALKYSPPGALVEICIRQEDGLLVISVMDRGRGLPAGEEEQLFDHFYRAKDLHESSIPGLGMGLPICHGLAVAHGGELLAKDREGGGAIFEVRVPMDPPESEGAETRAR